MAGDEGARGRQFSFTVSSLGVGWGGAEGDSELGGVERCKRRLYIGRSTGGGQSKGERRLVVVNFNVAGFGD